MYRKTGQGSTEYLVILATVLIVTGLAVFYISSAGGHKPTISMNAIFDDSDNSVKLYILQGLLPASEWKWRFLNPNGSENQGWTNATVDIDPRNSPITLMTLSNPVSGTYTIQIYHIPSESIYADIPVIVS